MDWKSHVRTRSHERCTTGKLLANVLLKTTVTSSLLVLACFLFVLVPPIFVATLKVRLHNLINTCFLKELLLSIAYKLSDRFIPVCDQDTHDPLQQQCGHWTSWEAVLAPSTFPLKHQRWNPTVPASQHGSF